MQLKLLLSDPACHLMEDRQGGFLRQLRRLAQQHLLCHPPGHPVGRVILDLHDSSPTVVGSSPKMPNHSFGVMPDMMNSRSFGERLGKASSTVAPASKERTCSSVTSRSKV